MPDPRERDPRFPDRPTHPDFIRLSEAVQVHDAMAEQLGLDPFAIIGVDKESLLYLMRNRFRVTGLIDVSTIPALQAAWMDGFALGKRYAESKTEEQDS